MKRDLLPSIQELGPPSKRGASTPQPPQTLRGIAGSPGIAIASAVVVGTSRSAYPKRTIVPEDVNAEIARFNAAVNRAQQDLRDVAARVTDKRAEASILEAYVMMVGDEVLADAVRVQ